MQFARIMNNTSTDGNCGSNSDTSATCLGSTYGDCCSSKGYCGETSAYCAEGCQLDFGECNDGSVQTVSTTGSCGSTKTSNVTCLGSTYGDCCSGKGYCGGNSSYCGSGCQSAFGNCGLDAMTASPSSSPGSSSTAVEDGLSKGAIAGISVGAAVGGLAIIALLGFLFIRRRKAIAGTDEKTDIKQGVSERRERHELNGEHLHEMEAKGPTQAPVELPSH